MFLDYSQNEIFSIAVASNINYAVIKCKFCIFTRISKLKFECVFNITASKLTTPNSSTCEVIKINFPIPFTSVEPGTLK